MPFVLRPAKPSDGPAFVELVKALAAFEKLAPPDDEATARLCEDAFSTKRFELLIAESEGRVVAYAVFFWTYSTFRARPSLYLEDLFVHPGARGQGIATEMMRWLAARAVAEGAGRFEWTVLDWNEGAQNFYRGLGANILPEWWLCRLDGDALVRLGATALSAPL